MISRRKVLPYAEKAICAGNTKRWPVAISFLQHIAIRESQIGWLTFLNLAIELEGWGIRNSERGGLHPPRLYKSTERKSLQAPCTTGSGNRGDEVSDALLPHLRLLVSIPHFNIPHFDIFSQASQNRSAKKLLAQLRQMERKSRTTKVSSRWSSSETLDDVRHMVERASSLNPFMHTDRPIDIP